MILHISGDYPDAVNAAKTPVIERLTALVGDRFEQRVISLNRRSPGLRFAAEVLRRGGRPRLTVERVGNGDVESVIYRAPARGVLHRTMLLQLGDWIAARAREGERPALLVAHKLTIEGIAVARAAALLGVPYAVVIQGNTDLRIQRTRPDLRRALARVFHGAATAFAFAPWALAATERNLGKRTGATIMLPCPMASDAILPPRVGDGTVVSLFHLRNWRIKNAPRLIAAARRPGAGPLAIVGGGSAADEAGLRALIRSGDPVKLEGALAGEAVAARLNAATGFAMPSLSESFGLVFLEALFAGVPILYPRGAAVDGYFDGEPFAIPVDARDTGAIAAAMARLRRDEQSLKRALAAWQAGPGPDRFRSGSIAQLFGDGLAGAMGHDRR